MPRPVKPTIETAQVIARQLLDGINAAASRARAFGDRNVTIAMSEAESMRDATVNLCEILRTLTKGPTE